MASRRDAATWWRLSETRKKSSRTYAASCVSLVIMSEASTYRWNTSGAAEAYDAAAPVIHPFYEKVQDEILDLLPFEAEEAFELVDIGGGSGRLEGGRSGGRKPE